MMFDLLRNLYYKTEFWSTDSWRCFYFKCLDRLEFGLKKYGKVMTPNDGRDSNKDAWEEAFDPSVYLLKAYKETGDETYSVLHDQSLNILIVLEQLDYNEVE